MKCEGLCKTCDNKDVRPTFRAGRYAPELRCDYDMTLFPHAKECRKYTARGHDDGDNVETGPFV